MQTDQETNSGNKIIHGDNLEALKALLPEYEGRIKCIYIDPPYNTGNEGWVYNDNVNDPKIKKWLGQVVGKESDDLTRHDKWLCMMISNFENSNTMNKILIILVAILLTSSCQQPNKEKAEENQLETEKRYQAKAPSTQTFGKEAFQESDNTTIRWLGCQAF
jgi:DNA modification methylase